MLQPRMLLLLLLVAKGWARVKAACDRLPPILSLHVAATTV